MGIDNTISETFTPDRTRRRLVLQCSVTTDGDIITPILTGFRDSCAVITIKNNGVDPLASVDVLVGMAPELVGAVSVPAAEGIWRATTDIGTLAAGAMGVIWIERPLGCCFAVKVVGESFGDVEVSIDVGMFYAQPAN